MKSFFLLFVVVICCAITNAQAPPNDNACQATQLTVGTVCNYQTFTTENATSSAGSIAPNCANFISGTTADVWFKVTVPASGGLVLNTQAGVVTDGGMAVYRSSATCIALTFLACNDSSVANGDMPALTITGQTPGATLYIRFWEKGSDNDGTFGICATDIPASPPNDEPCNAIQLTAGTTCAYQTFTNAYASNTTSIAAPVCGGFLGGDVWFKTTMPASGGLLFDTQTGSVTDGGMAVYTGTDCGNISQIYLACDDNSSANGDMPSLFITDQAPGTTLWVRFWENGNNNNGTFGICVTNVQTPPPSNDEPCSAIELPAETNCNYQVFTNLYATATNNIADPPCANYTGGDVWFKVAMPAGSAGLLFDTQAGDITDGGMAVYSGAACSNLTLIACDDDFSSNGPMPSILVSNTASYDTLWVRFWEHGGDNNGTFSVCVKNLPATANDDPCNAIQLGVDTVCHYQTFTTENATASPGVPLPDCANYAGGDVWFKVTVPVMGSMVFDTQQGDIVDGGMAVYSGTNCDSLTFIACDDDASTNGQMPMLAINHQPVGSTLWVRFWEYGNDSRGTFSICVKSIEFPVNDEPCNAIELTADSVSNYQYFTNLNATVSWSVGFPLCANVNDDVWFKVTVPAGGSVLIDTKEGDIADGGMAVYAGTRCDSLTYLGCDDNASVNGRMPALVVDNQAPGTTLWIRFWRNGALGGNDGTFGIGVNRSSPLWTNVTYTKYPVDFGNVIQFSDSSTTSGGFPIVSWHWQFGDGDTSNLQNPVDFSSSTGPQVVSVTTRNSNNQYQTRVGLLQTSILIPQVLKMNLCPPMDSTRISTYVLTGNVQWEMSTDSVNFTSISDNANFSGTNTPVLTLRNIPANWHGRRFRCTSDEGYSSWTTEVKFANVFTNTADNNWENTANWSCGVLPDANTNVIINGTATLNSNTSCRSLYVNPGATFTVSPGFTLTITQ